jgi:hypothetical protein
MGKVIASDRPRESAEEAETAALGEKGGKRRAAGAIEDRGPALPERVDEASGGTRLESDARKGGKGGGESRVVIGVQGRDDASRGADPADGADHGGQRGGGRAGRAGAVQADLEIIGAGGSQLEGERAGALRPNRVPQRGAHGNLRATAAPVRPRVPERESIAEQRRGARSKRSRRGILQIEHIGALPERHRGLGPVAHAGEQERPRD